MKILEVRALTSERWLNLYEASYEHEGKTGRWVYASRRDQNEAPPKTPDAVVIVPLVTAPGHEPQLILQKEFRIPLGTYNYAFPAGLLEPGESIEDTVRRELLEETGLELTRIKRISPCLNNSAGLTDETCALVFVDAKVPNGGAAQQLDSAEEIEVLRLDHEEVCQLCDSPDLSVDAKAWCVLYLYQQLGQFA